MTEGPAMGVFDAMTTVVLEAGRLDREEERPVTVAAPPPRRFRLPRMPALPVLLLTILVA
ncbi:MULTISPECIES: hypothetical protein [Azospirillum]|uniref:Uncharacterized protein n=1 Tax=Azospirillum brasilense TaxID=192 RepID=A0ABU4P9N7_AZOBR|nr:MULTISPECIES: hypothetical protein [Azospirillum]MDW7552860.1 hypothetical protein [Azospirillum brasilense]MDW7591948.1 hypothetical protein [Azospirillum brasilense]MDW7627775.1 hypothetical protein [Azospirillum brasilense]MDX5952756.1 hypothetical protein [Azospirillum brasilense]NUB11479.1 hypothetical protein [Azospirillum brasilense]